MAYYAGDGDYYRPRGDPGVFDFLKKAASTAFNFLAPKPVVMAAKGVGLAISENKRLRNLPGYKPLFGGRPAMQLPAIPAARGRALPSIRAPYDESGRGRKGRYKMVQSPSGVPVGTWTASRRRMNVANIKALKRAIRRLAGFQKVALGVFALLRGVALPTSSRRKAKCTRCGRARCICRRALPRGRGDMMLGDFYQGDG